MSTLPTFGTVRYLQSGRLPPGRATGAWSARRCESIDVAEHIPEAVVETRADDSLWKSPLMSAIMLRDARPSGRDITGFCTVPEIDKHGGLSRHGHALRVVEAFQFL